MQATEKLFLQTVGRFVQERIAQLFEPVIGRLAKLEFVIDNLTKRDATDGADSNNRAGLGADDIRALVRDEIARAFDALPSKPHVVSCYIDRDGDLYFTNSDGGAFKVGHVVGKDADPAFVDAAIKAACEKYPRPKDGKDGFSLTDFQMEFDGERTITTKFESGNIKKEFKFEMPTPLYRGVWREGFYHRGDVVTRDGSTWIALVDTETQPGTPDSGWQLAVKRGRDGKDKR